MKLELLKLTNFVGIPEAVIEFKKPVSMFVGRNNQGKSSIRDSIEFALTGKTRGMTKFNQTNNLIRGNNGMLVELDTVDKETGEIHKNKCSKNGLSIGKRFPLATYCLNPDEFIRLPAKKRGMLLAEVLGGGMQELVKDAIDEHIGLIDDDIVAEIKSSGVNIFDLEALKEEVVELRRQYKRNKKELPENHPLLADYDLDEGYDVDADKKKVEELGKRICKGSEYLAAVKHNMLIKATLIDIEKAIEKEKAKIKKVPDLGSDVSPDDVRMASVYSSIIDEILNGNKSSNCICPVCNSENKRKWFEKRKDEIECWLSDYADRLIEHDRIAAENECAKNEIANLERRRRELNQKFIRVDDSAVKYKKGSEDLLERLTAERDKLQANIANYSRFEEALKQYEQAKKKAARLDELIAECNRIDDALKDGGPVKSAVAKGGRKLPINENLLRLWNMEELTWSDNGDITLGDVPIEYASASERYRAGCVMALALAEVSGIGIASLDGFEILDSDNASAFMQAVEDCKIDNVLVFYSTDKNYADVNIPDWLDIFIVDKGKVTKVT